MEKYEKQGGVAFFLLHFVKEEIYYYLRLCDLLVFWERANSGGRKSFRMDELDEKWFFKSPNGLLVPYLDKVNEDLALRP